VKHRALCWFVGLVIALGAARAGAAGDPRELKAREDFAAGRYQELSPRSRVQVTFRLERTGGEWRISQMPDNFGTWLSQADLDRLYDPFRIYYVSAGDHRLVPDIRWLPLGTGLATRLARSLLAGVPDYLKGAVRTDIPAGTKLAVDAVTVASGTAKVDLSATKLGNDPGQRQNLGAQFLATVTQAPGVERVALQLEGADLQMPNGDSTVDSLSLLGFPTPSDPLVKPVLRVGTTLVAVDPDDVGDNGQRPPPQAASHDQHEGQCLGQAELPQPPTAMTSFERPGNRDDNRRRRQNIEREYG